MNYSRPVCECGDELTYEKELTVNRYHQLTKRGKISKKFRSKDNPINPLEYLLCDTCTKRYEVDYDDQDRVIRGELAF